MNSSADGLEGWCLGLCRIDIRNAAPNSALDFAIWKRDEIVSFRFWNFSCFPNGQFDRFLQQLQNGDSIVLSSISYRFIFDPFSQCNDPGKKSTDWIRCNQGTELKCWNMKIGDQVNTQWNHIDKVKDLGKIYRRQ